MYLCVRERVRVCLLSETSSSCKICAFFCVVSMALSILCKTNKLAFEQVRGLNKHSRRDSEDFLPSQLPSPAKRKRKCVEEPAHLGCRTWARGRNFPRESVSLVAGRCGHTIGIDVQWTGSDSPAKIIPTTCSYSRYSHHPLFPPPTSESLTWQAHRHHANFIHLSKISTMCVHPIPV